MTKTENVSFLNIWYVFLKKGPKILASRYVHVYFYILKKKKISGMVEQKTKWEYYNIPEELMISC